MVAGNRFPKNTYFPEMLISKKGKCMQGVWLSRKSFYGNLIPVFDSSKYFTENTLRKTFSHVWFGKYFTENSLDQHNRAGVRA